MTFLDRDYQIKLEADVFQAWDEGKQNVLAVSPTGSGKTRVKADIINKKAVPAVAIAHRQELVTQISCALAQSGLYHRIIAPKAIIGSCVTQHIELFGRSYYHAQAPASVAGVDTLLHRSGDLAQYLNHIKLWDIDEAHHVLKGNKWGKATALFSNALGVGFTATPTRADRKALGRTKSGVFDSMVVGPTMRDLIDRRYLADYRIFAPKVSINLASVEISQTTGDFNQDQLRKEAHRSTITGDIVESYLRYTPGKLGITFTVDVEQAIECAAAYNARGVRAEVVSAKTPGNIRINVMRAYRRREILQLVNCDLFGEGMDVPGVEVVSMGRPTNSYGLYIQQFGRCLRPAIDKTHGILLDHVNNVVRHGLPDKTRIWSLEDEAQGRKKAADAIPIRICTACYQPYEAIFKVCPYCGYREVPASRGAPEFVDGDLEEYSPELLARMRAEVERIDNGVLLPRGLSQLAEAGIKNRHFERQQAQAALRDTMSAWAGIWKYVHDHNDSMLDRRFYHTFGVDRMSAFALGRPDAERLTNQIRETMI